MKEERGKGPYRAAWQQIKISPITQKILKFENLKKTRFQKGGENPPPHDMNRLNNVLDIQSQKRI